MSAFQVFVVTSAISKSSCRPRFSHIIIVENIHTTPILIFRAVWCYVEM